MSVELCVFLDGAKLPTLTDWQDAISESGYDLHLDDCSPREHTGFWPTRLNGVDCGYEYSLNPVEPHEPEEVLAAIGDRSHVATFVFRGDDNDCRAAMCASAVLARLSDPLEFLTSLDHMERESGSLNANADDWMHEYHGTTTLESRDLPWLDADKSFFVAINARLGDDVAVALDFRSSLTDPRVVASEWSDDGCQWRQCADTFSEFVDLLGL